MLLHLLAILERMVQFGHQVTLLIRQSVRILGIHCWQESILHRILLAIIAEHLTFKINHMKQLPTLHVKLRTPVNDFSLQFKLNHGDSLVHLSNQTQRFLIMIYFIHRHLRCKHLTRVICIRLHGEGGQRKQINAIPIFQRGQISIAHSHTNHIRHASIITGSSAHPEQIMVTPLNIKIMIVAQRIHNDVSSWSSIIDISHYMQSINGQTLYQVTHGNDKIIRPSGRDDCADNHIDVSMLIRFDRRLMHQLLNDIGKLFRQRLTHLRSGIL